MTFLKLPKPVLFIIKTLEKNNFEAYVVGGCVRDYLLGIKPKDWDICTNATPTQIKKIFYNFNIIETGIKFGTMSIIIDKKSFEITTYRRDLEYANHRKPSKTLFINNLKEDLKRRDFTINAMAYNDKFGIVDYFNGISHIKSKTICCVGNPSEKFQEDALRIMRGIRFCSIYGFNIDQKTRNAMFKNSHLLNFLSTERISSEFLKTLQGKYLSNAFKYFKNILVIIMPELKSLTRIQWKLTEKYISQCENLLQLRLALLFKFSYFNNFQQNNDYNFFKSSNNLIIPKKYTNPVEKIIKNQNMPTPSNIKETCHILLKIHPNTYSAILKFKKACAINSKNHIKKILKAQNLLDIVIKNNICYSKKQLKINGEDLIKIGYKQGPAIGQALNKILNEIISKNLKNDKDVLIEFAKKINNND